MKYELLGVSLDSSIQENRLLPLGACLNNWFSEDEDSERFVWAISL